MITPDGKRIIAIAISSEERPDPKGTLKPAASRGAESSGASGLDDGVASKYPMAKMERHIVIYNVETGKIQACVLNGSHLQLVADWFLVSVAELSPLSSRRFLCRRTTSTC